ncbi:ATP-binding protein, partial [Rudaea sp.]|uniref:ATP-binding protein n=1 Tax=Rudaea sp. TaxID=2136325 RepID=UPI002ED4E77E
MDHISQGAALGRVLSVNGSQTQVRLAVSAQDVRATVGKFLGIDAGNAVVIGVITKIGAQAQSREGELAVAAVDMLGEIKRGERGEFFQRGVTEYPMIGDAVEMVTQRELRLIFDMSGPGTIDIGALQQDTSIAAYVNVDDMVRKHFAVFGTTGVGKSSGVALLLRQVLDARPDLRVFLIDPHNEYGHCFDDRAQTLSPKNLKLPFWLFNFEEIVDVFFRGRPGVEEEVEILSELVPIAKTLFQPTNAPGARRLLRSDPKSSGVTIDTPVPYRLEDLIRLIDERMGKLENRSAWARYHRLITRIETARNDPRYGFMFDNANVGGDTMVETVSTLFRLPPNGVPMTIMQLAGFPAEVVDSVVSVLLRMAFEFGLWSDGAFPLLVVCEESHRYAPADRSIGFGPTRKAVSRIAKEGRKYGVFLGLITQRPAELDATIISQCSTLFAMRMANDRDQAIVRSAVSDAAGSLIAFVPSLGTREVFAFGEGVALPTRLRFKQLEPQHIPHSQAVTRANMDSAKGVDVGFLLSVIERWRGATMGGQTRARPGGSSVEGEFDDIEALASNEFTRVRPETPGA